MNFRKKIFGIVRLIILYLLLTNVLTSCYDKSLVDPGRASANITLKVFSKDNVPAKNAQIRIRESSTYQILYDTIADSKGEFRSKLLEGGYYFEISILVDGISYHSNKFISVFGNLDRVYQFRPYNNLGQINIYLKNFNGKPKPGVNVTLLTKVVHNTNLSFEEYNKYAYLTGVTDTNAKITFHNIPIGHLFGCLIYKNDSVFYYGTTGLVADGVDNGECIVNCDF